MKKSIYSFCLVLISNVISAQTSNKLNPNTFIGNSTHVMGAALGSIEVIVPIADRVTFAYDESGNQRERKLCINCVVNKPAPAGENLVSKNVDTIQDDNLKFYPNPVTEDLFIEFNVVNVNKKITTIEVFSLTGQVLRKYTDVNTSETLKIPFVELPQGVYVVNVKYNDGEIVDLKIVKK